MKWIPLPPSVVCVAVSKKQSIDAIREAWSFGYRHFGESYVQEALPKIQALKQGTWHFIGRIQSNKIKEIAQYFDVIHSLTSVDHARKLDLACVALQKRMDVFIQVNLAAEPQKDGIPPEALASMIASVQSLSHLNLLGLMLIPKQDERENERVADFKQMQMLLTQHQRALHPQFQHLSMGMSEDYNLAIQQGATHVRIGTAIFGGRV